MWLHSRKSRRGSFGREVVASFPMAKLYNSLHATIFTPSLHFISTFSKHNRITSLEMLHKSPSGTWVPAYVPRSQGILAALLLITSAANSCVSPFLLCKVTILNSLAQTIGYDGSMINGLNILPSYTSYFVLTPATLGLQTASIFIGGSIASIISGIACDRLGRRPTMFWSFMISLIGVLMQTIAQNVAMFTVARIIIGFGTTMAGVAGAVYLSETCAFQWRAWGVGLLNDFF